jgi:L-rhamnonate dehydratase
MEAGLQDELSPRVSPIADVRAVRLQSGADPVYLDGSNHTLLVEVEDADGRIGIGETDSASSAAQAVVTMANEQDWNWGLRSVLLGQDPLLIGALWDKQAAATAYQGPSGIARHALAAVDIALHDLAGKQLGRPAYHLLGGPRREHLTPYATVFVPLSEESSLAQMTADTLALMERAVALGFQAVKMELIFGPLAADRDLVQCIREGRAVIGDDVELLLDFGYRWSDWRDPCWVLDQTEDCRIWLAEATLPMADLEGHAKLSARVPTRIGGGELASTFEECRACLELGHVDVVQADIARCGGLTEMQRVADLASMHGASVIPHCWKTGINAAATRHFQAATANVPFIEMLVPDLFASPLRHGLVGPEPTLSDGVIALPTAPGLGIELASDVVERYRVDPRSLHRVP